MTGSNGPVPPTSATSQPGDLSPSRRSLRVSIPDATLLPHLGDLPPEVELFLWDMEAPPPAETIDIVVPPYMSDGTVLRVLDAVQTGLVQGQSIGYNGVAEALPKGHRYANAAGVHETSAAELTVAMILAAQRGIPGFVRDAALGDWKPIVHPSLADRRVLLIGYGGLGRAIEKRLLAFEVDLTRVASRPRRDERGAIHGIGELPGLLPTCDIAVVSVPLTPETTGLINARFLSALPEGALVVNVARGQVADTAAVLSHARSGRLRFALDVTDPEPLPPGHELFALPNVLICPHVGGASSAMPRRMAGLLRRQIDLLLKGEAPVNVVIHSERAEQGPHSL